MRTTDPKPRHHNLLRDTVASVAALGTLALGACASPSATSPEKNPTAATPSGEASKPSVPEAMSNKEVFNAQLDQLLSKTDQELYPLPQELQANNLVNNRNNIRALFKPVVSEKANTKERATEYIVQMYDRFNASNRLASSDIDTEAASNGQSTKTDRRKDFLEAWRGMQGYDDTLVPAEPEVLSNTDSRYARYTMAALGHQTAAFPTANVQIPNLDEAVITTNADGTFSAEVPERFIAKFDKEVARRVMGDDNDPAGFDKRWGNIDVVQIREFKNCGVKKGSDMITCSSSGIKEDPKITS